MIVKYPDSFFLQGHIYIYYRMTNQIRKIEFFGQRHLRLVSELSVGFWYKAIHEENDCNFSREILCPMPI